MKLFSDLIFLATTSWNQDPYSTTFAPLLHAIQDFQKNRDQYKQKRALLSYNLYLNLSSKARDEQFLSSLSTYTLPKLPTSEIYPPPNHGVYETEEIQVLWEHHLLHGRQPDSRLRRHPLLLLEEGRLKLDIARQQSAMIQDEATGEIVAMIYRNFMPRQYHSILEWINATILASIHRKRSARVSSYPITLSSDFSISNLHYINFKPLIQLEDLGKIVQTGYSGGSRSHPQFDWAKNLLSKNFNPEEQQQIDYLESSVFALFWNMARRLIHGDISKDIEEFLETGVKRIDAKGKGENNTYTIQYEGEVFEFKQGQLAPPVGFFASNYSRYVIKYKV